jgi:formylglycine-generating enzyme required for sulfatase activity
MMQERSAPRYWARHPESRAWMASRYGSLRTLNPDEAVRHVSLYEAQAWCMWAGRRLPDEAEWELAATQNRGLHWGALREWTATPYESYGDFEALPPDDALAAAFGSHQAVRGVSFASPVRQRHAKARWALLPEDDFHFVGFRTCAL